MFPGYVEVNVTFDISDRLFELVQGDKSELSRIKAKLDSIQIGVTQLLMTQQEITDLLNGIDKTTNAIAANVQTIATVDKTISDEIDAFLAATPVGTVLTDAQAAQLKGFADKLQVTSDASTAQVSVLQAIAAKGQPNVPPPPPPPPAA